MIKSFKLMCKTFYDISFVRNYIKSGDGTGTSFLAFIAMIMSLIVTLVFAFQFSFMFDSDQTNAFVDKFLQSSPTIIIENGELQYPDNTINRYTIKDLGFHDIEPEEDLEILVINTVDSSPNMSEIKKSVLYITKSDVYVHNPENGEIKTLKLKKLQKMFHQDRVELTSRENIDTTIKFMKGFMVAIIGLLFIFVFLFDWLINVILAVLTRTFATVMNTSLAKLAPEELRRAATVSVTPVLLLVCISQAVFGVPGSLVKWLAVTIIGIIIINKYVPTEKEQETSEENAQKS